MQSFAGQWIEREKNRHGSKNVFPGRPVLAKGFKHRELAVSWAALTHNLWLVARMAETEEKREEDEEQNTRLPQARAA